MARVAKETKKAKEPVEKVLDCLAVTDSRISDKLQRHGFVCVDVAYLKMPGETKTYMFQTTKEAVKGTYEGKAPVLTAEELGGMVEV